jgi:hypothetical protein
MTLSVHHRSRRRSHGLGLAAIVIISPFLLPIAAAVHVSAAEHADQTGFTDLVANGRPAEAFTTAFKAGDELFATPFNALDGGGANVGQGQRFTRTPRADLNGLGEWATHLPSRTTGPNAQACTECHIAPAEDGSGGASANVSRDPGHTASPGSFINRNTPALFGLGAIQRLAEEMSAELRKHRDAAVAQARSDGKNVTKLLTAKGVAFGSITARPDGSVDTSQVSGVDPDLVVKPFQWKGSIASIRDFVRGAAHNELGMQAVELVGDAFDGDFDGVSDELTVGDVTALTVYNAAQPRPVTRMELAAWRLIPALDDAETAAIQSGETAFDRAGCGSCHVKQLTIVNPVFSEPSQQPEYRDAVLPAGQDPASRGVSPTLPITFDLTADHPDNRIITPSGRTVRLGSFERNTSGQAVVRLFGDLKRHDMGPGLAESIDEAGTGASTFKTANLWGVGSTAPYLHDGRATTLTEAILAHGGEGKPSKAAFLALPAREQRNLVAFLNNLVLYKLLPAEAATGTPSIPPPHKRHRH